MSPFSASRPARLVAAALGAAGALLLGPGLSAGCAVENPDHVEDSTGAETGWGCAGGRCDTRRESFSALPPECGGEDTELLVGAGAIALLCAVSVGPEGEELVHELTCRPLVCADDLACPQWASRSYTCLEGLCQVNAAEGWTLDRLDFTALCLAELPRQASCAEAEADPEVARRLARIDDFCDDAGCSSVPEGCLSP